MAEFFCALTPHSFFQKAIDPKELKTQTKGSDQNKLDSLQVSKIKAHKAEGPKKIKRLEPKAALQKVRIYKQPNILLPAHRVTDS